MSEASVLLAVEHSIARITLNRPEKGNALDQAMADALLDIAIRCASDEAIRCVVLTGAGRMFCAGGDVSVFAANSDNISGFLARLAGTLHLALSQFASMPKPLLTAINGPAAGAGLSLAIAGDLVLAGRSANFVAAYGAIGFTPDGGMTWTLPRLVGLRRAQEILLTNRRVAVEEAAAIGLVTRMVEDDQLIAETDAAAKTLVSGAVAAMGLTRRLLHESMSSDFASQMDREARSIAATGGSSEGREGLAAHLARRKPKVIEG
ncbi:enoyl-CoA hydratase/isomerase family protein [Bradyrhizobium vignae]|uniref:enoyl-CoA hydratase/isomerase family protein n=1 Tax=Bradyrhizobium vignae TaxID=1549949 RepID=UPI001ABF0575|nr:enoyl-CoA hydratase-related protein [Bradyrhizobium vignae]